MKNKFAAGILALLLAGAMLCAACAPAAPAPETVPAPTEEAVVIEAEATPEAVAAAPETAATAEPAQSSDAEAREAYRAALETLIAGRTLPGGDPLPEELSFDSTENQFAIFDVDGDGQDELLIVIANAPMAGQGLYVYGYDTAAKQLRNELTEYPLVTFYDNGLAKADWSHNQGLAGDFWPYSLYRYDAAAGSYALVGMVDAWSKAFAAVNSDGSTFPDAVDTSGTGVVYYIMTSGEYDTTPVDVTAYDAWVAENLAGASALDVPYTALTEANVAALSTK